MQTILTTMHKALSRSGSSTWDNTWNLTIFIPSLLAVCLGGAFIHLRDRELLRKIAELEERIASNASKLPPYEPVHDVLHEHEPFNESINSSMQEELERLTSRVIEDIDAHKGNLCSWSDSTRHAETTFFTIFFISKSSIWGHFLLQ